MSHIIVGIGGIGSAAVRALRRLVYQEFRGSTPPQTRLDCLLVDTALDPAAADPQARIFGRAVPLDDADILIVRPASLAAARARLGSHPASRYLYERVEAAARADDDRTLMALCDSIRRLGRLLVAQNRPALEARLRALCGGRGADPDRPMTFHVVFGLGDGMGGGLVEVIAAIRTLFPDAASHRILLYGHLPDVTESGGDAASGPLANAYAALVELHALATGAMAPADTGMAPGSAGATVNAAYLFGHQQENGAPIGGPEELFAALAQFLLQRTSIDDNIGAARLRQVEDGQGAFGADDFGWQATDAARLLIFGTKKLASPDSEIGEALALTFARGALLQLLHNNWQDGVGFIEEPPPTDSASSFVRRTEVENRWMLSEDHILLSLSVLPEHAANSRWRAISDEWTSVMDAFKDMARLQERSKWLDTITTLCHRRYTEDFREVGVAAFYRSRYDQTATMATAIRKRVEHDLFEEWSSGARPMAEVRAIVDALLAQQEERLAKVDERIARIRASEDETRARIIGTFQKWAQLGSLARFTGKPDVLLDEHAVHLHELHVKMTRAEAWAFARRFLPDIVAELRDLKDVVDTTAGMLEAALKAVDQRLDTLADLLEAVPDTYSPLVRLFNRDRVRSVAAAFTTNEREQIQQSNRLRADLFVDGRRSTFEAFNAGFADDGLLPFIIDASDRNARSAHATQVATEGERVLGISVIEQIREMYGNDPSALRTFIDTALSETQCFAELTPPDVGATPPARRQYVLLPRNAKPESFVKQLKSVVRSCAAVNLEFLETEQRPFEVGVVTVQSAVPLQQFAYVGTYAMAYEARLIVDTATAFYEMHTVSAATPLEPLIAKAPERRKEKAAAFGLPHLLAGLAVDIVYLRPAGPAGAECHLLVPKDADGFDEPPITLAPTLLESAEMLDAGTLALLSASLKQVLKSDRYADPAQRERLRQAIVTQVNRVRAERGDDPADPVYRSFVEAGKAATRLLKGE